MPTACSPIRSYTTRWYSCKTVKGIKRCWKRIKLETTKNQIVAHQKPDGSFSYCCEVDPLSDAIMVSFLNLIGYSSDPLIPDLCHMLVHRQRPDGGWTVYPGEEANGSATTLVYFALLLSGLPKTSPPMLKARSYIVKHGGITCVSSFVKVLLAAAGQLPWSILPDLQIEMALWESSDPISLYDLSSPARVHLPSIMILSHLNYSYRLSGDVSLADLVGHDVEIPKHRIPLRNERAVERCRTFLLERVEPNGTLASYLSSTVLMVFALQALGYSSGHPRIVHAILGLKDMVYRRKSFKGALSISENVSITMEERGQVGACDAKR